MIKTLGSNPVMVDWYSTKGRFSIQPQNKFKRPTAPKQISCYFCKFEGKLACTVCNFKLYLSGPGFKPLSIQLKEEICSDSLDNENLADSSSNMP